MVIFKLFCDTGLNINHLIIFPQCVHVIYDGRHSSHIAMHTFFFKGIFLKRSTFVYFRELLFQNAKFISLHSLFPFLICKKRGMEINKCGIMTFFSNKNLFIFLLLLTINSLSGLLQQYVLSHVISGYMGQETSRNLRNYFVSLCSRL